MWGDSRTGSIPVTGTKNAARFCVPHFLSVFSRSHIVPETVRVLTPGVMVQAPVSGSCV